MITIQTQYEGELRTSAIHVQSQVKILTDAPIDNKGRGESFSPTDLLAASLGSCMLTIVGILAENQEFSIDGAKVDIIKIMAANPRRVIEIKLTLLFPGENYTSKQIEMIERAARTCPVALSLHPDIKQNIIFKYAND